MKSKIRFVLLIVLAVVFGLSNLTAQTTSVYVVPHPDDWQLFMNPNAYKSIKGTNEKVIFLHTTAGDGGGGTGNTHYLAREEGSLRAIRFMSNTFTNEGALGDNMNQTTVTVNGHQILKFSYRNAVAYFLRLPDGNLNGQGYPLHSNKSLQKLYNGSISTISAIDGTTTYNSLADLEATMQAIVTSEMLPASSVIFNAADHDSGINPDDHSDHINSSLIMQDVANTMGGVTLKLYTEYSTANLAQNVFNDDYLVSAAAWGVTASGISDKSYFSTWDNTHNVWIGKQYFRTLSSNNNPVASVIATDATAGESPLDTGTFTISLAAVNNGSAIIINYAVGGTATSGSDYTALSGTVSIANGQQSKTVTVTPIDDTEVEPTETVILTLSGGSGYSIGSPSSATVNISSEDTTPPGTNIAQFKTTTASGYQSLSYMGVDNNYTRNNYWKGIPFPQWWQVDLGSNYDLSKVVVFTYYDSARYYKYDVQGSIDGTNWTTLVDYNANTIPATSSGNTFNLSNPQARYIRINMNYNSANSGVHLIEFEAYGVLSGQSNPIATISATDSAAAESPLDDGTYLVNLNAVNNGSPLTVNYTVGGTATPGSDYTALSGTVTIPNGQQSATITVTPINDIEIESTETVIATLSAGTGYTVGTSNVATVNITSEDTAPPTGNIAFNKPTNSSAGMERPGALAVDNIYTIDNWWGASPYPQWWSVDLGNSYNLSKVVVFNYYDGIRYYQYDIQGSLDGTNWTTLANFNNNTTPATSQGNTFNLSNPSARYLRVNMNFNSANVGVHIVEFEAYGTLSSSSKTSQDASASLEKSIFKTNSNSTISIYPNPNKQGNPINLDVNSKNDDRAYVEVYDLMGKKLMEREYSLFSGFNEIGIPSSQFSIGMLIVKVTIQGEIITKKIFLE